MNHIKHILLIGLFFVSGLQADFHSTGLVYSMDELTLSNYRYLGDLLDHLPGVWVRDLGSVGQWSTLRMSGASSKETRICLNGIPILDSWTMETDLNWIPVDLIDRIEIYPSGNPFGLSASGGVINMVTKEEPVSRPESIFNYRTGNLGFNDLDIKFFQSITSDVSYGFGALLEKYAEEIPSRTFEKQNLRGIISVRLWNRINLKYRILMNKMETNIPDLFYFPAGQLALTSPFRKTDRTDHFFHIQSHIFNIQNQIQVHLSNNKFEYRQRNHSNTATYPVSSTSLHFNQDYSNIGIPLQMGFWWNDQSLAMPGSEKVVASNYRIYTNTKIPLYGPILFQGSAAFSKMDQVPSTWNGNAHLLWSHENHWSLSIGGASEARYPNLGELFSVPILHGPEETLLEYALLRKAATNTLTPQMSAERNHIFDAAIQYKKDSWLALYTRMFYRRTSDLIRFNGNLITPLLINTGQHNFYGIESSGNLGPFYGFGLQMTLNFIQSEDESRNVLLERPNLWGSGALSWKRSFFEDDLRVHFRLVAKYRSEFWCLAGDELALTGLAGSVLEFKTILTFLQSADVFFSMDNLLDTNLYRVYGYPIANRSYRYGIKWKLFD